MNSFCLSSSAEALPRAPQTAIRHQGPGPAVSGQAMGEDAGHQSLNHLGGEQVKDVDDGPYTLVADLVGIAQGRPDNLARRHKQALRDLLAGNGDNV